MTKIIAAVLLSCLLLQGCTPRPIYTYPIQVGTTWCRHTALLAAAVCGEFYPVVIVVGLTPNGKHAQARCQIEGEWEWLQVKNGDVFVGEEEGPFIAERRDMEIHSFMELMDISYPIQKEGQ